MTNDLNLVAGSFTQNVSDFFKSGWNKAGELGGHIVRVFQNLPQSMQANQNVAIGTFVTTTAVSFFVMNLIANWLNSRAEAAGHENELNHTPGARIVKAVLLNGVLVGGSVLGANVLVSRLTHYPLSKMVLCAITVAAIAVRSIYAWILDKKADARKAEQEVKKKEEAEKEKAEKEAAVLKKKEADSLKAQQQEAKKKAQQDAADLKKKEEDAKAEQAELKKKEEAKTEQEAEYLKNKANEIKPKEAGTTSGATVEEKKDEPEVKPPEVDHETLTDIVLPSTDQLKPARDSIDKDAPPFSKEDIELAKTYLNDPISSTIADAALKHSLIQQQDVTRKLNETSKEASKHLKEALDAKKSDVEIEEATKAYVKAGVEVRKAVRTMIDLIEASKSHIPTVGGEPGDEFGTASSTIGLATTVTK